MESTDTTVMRLEAEFDQHLMEIKPYVLKLSQKNGQLMFSLTWYSFLTCKLWSQVLTIFCLQTALSFSWFCIKILYCYSYMLRMMFGWEARCQQLHSIECLAWIDFQRSCKLLFCVSFFTANYCYLIRKKALTTNRKWNCKNDDEWYVRARFFFLKCQFVSLHYCQDQMLARSDE